MQQLQQFHQGTAFRAYEFMGCHREDRGDTQGFLFRVWAPNAKNVHLVGDFNFWDTENLPMERLEQGVWQVWSENAREGMKYKFLVTGADGRRVYKADPYAFRAANQPDTSSVICPYEGYKWNDTKFRRQQGKRKPQESPINIYEFHLGSWRRKENGGLYTYAELAPMLAEYLTEMGYTHVELMPLTEYPYEPSWGYQVTGYYSPTYRYGSPRDLMVLVDTLHQAGIGVIMDWVPAHFPKDEYGLYEFDGGCTYELSDPMMNEHPDWTTRIFDFGKPEVRSFLISSAVYWLEVFHMDGIRVDAVSSMLYLDYNRPHYRPNKYGGRENLEAMDFLRQLNKTCLGLRPGIIMAAEESTPFPMVTGREDKGGLGFTFKWNMGWMNDTLRYMKEDPIYRKHHHNTLTFSMTYAFSEDFLLPLSHDEVVHCKGSLVNKMPGEYDQKFANLRAMLGYQMAHPGKKLLFMGGEIGQFAEWNPLQQLDWMLLDYEKHHQLQSFVKDLNHFYLQNPPLWNNDQDWEGFQWIEPDDADNSILAFRRIDRRKREVLVIINLTPVARERYRLGVPRAGIYQPALCSDDPRYGGWGVKPVEAVAERKPFRDYKHSALFRVPPMSITIYTYKRNPET